MIVTFEKNGRTYSADVEKLPAASVAYLLQYGWSQSLQDCIAGRAKRVADEYAAKNADETDDGEPYTPAEIAAAIDEDLNGTLAKRADSILAGTMGQRDSAPRDPFKAMCNRVAMEILRGAAKAQQRKLPKDPSDLLAQVMAKHQDRIEAEAKRRLESVEAFEIEI